MTLYNKIVEKIKRLAESIKWYPEELFPKKAYAPVVKRGNYYPRKPQKY